MIDALQGPPRWDGPDVLLRQRSFRAPAEPRRFRQSDGSVSHGTLVVRFGEAEARGVALTPKSRERYADAMAAADLVAVSGLPWQDAAESVWPQYLPVTDTGLAANGLAYYRHDDPTQPIVYGDFLRRSAAGIFRSNLDSDAVADGESCNTGYDLDRTSGAIGQHIHDPYALYEKAAR